MTPIQLPDNADYFQINDVNIHPENIWLKLGMVDPIEITQYELAFRNLLHLTISKAVDDDNDGVYQIMEIQVVKTLDPQPILDQLGYSFVGQLPQNEYYYLRSVGDLSIQVVAAQFDLAQVSAQDSSFKPRLYPPKKP